MIGGCYTAIVTPFKDAAKRVDYKKLEELSDFQITNGITGILAVGTTGEAPTLNWEEHNTVVTKIAAQTKTKVTSIASAGSNNTAETIEATKHAVNMGVDAILLVDPYYNGPSSLEIRKEYIEPVAQAFPDTEIIPYIIPGRTGTQLFPEDLAVLSGKYKNINAVKEATGNIENMKRTRECCGKNFTILSGDDSMVFQMMTDPKINCKGVISVASNVAPKASVDMINYILDGKMDDAKNILSGLKPLFDLVTVTTREKTPFGEVECRARNPLALKTFMGLIGILDCGCRRPLGKMTKTGFNKVLEIARKVQNNNPEILKPAVEFFNINMDERLNNATLWENLYYN